MEPYPHFLLMGLALLPVALNWTEGRFTWRACGWGLLLSVATGALVGGVRLLLRQRGIAASNADPLGYGKYVLGALFVGAVLVGLTMSFVRMRRPTSAAARARWPFRMALVVLLLFSFWQKITLFYGDEPWYLLQASSFAHAGDPLIADDFRRSAYREYATLTMSDTQYLAGMSVNPADPPDRVGWYFGVSLFMAPFYRLGMEMGMSPYLLRIWLGLPFILLAAFAVGRLTRWLARERGDARFALWLPFCLLAVSPLHVWIQTQSPQAMQFFLLTCALVELMDRESTTLRWTALALCLLSWLHPGTYLVMLLLWLWCLAVRPRPRALAVGALAALSLAIKLLLDWHWQVGIFGGYTAAASKWSIAPYEYPLRLLSHWVAADAGILFFAPVYLAILFAMPTWWRKRARWLYPGLFILSQVLFAGLFSPAHYVNGIGRLNFWWMPTALAMALAVGQARRFATGTALVLGALSNWSLTTLTLVQSRMPSAGIREFFGVDFARFAPQTGRRPDLLLVRAGYWEPLLTVCWAVVLVVLYRCCWVERETGWEEASADAR